MYKKIFIYKRLGILLYFISLIPAYINDTTLNFITIILLIVGTICMLLFRCPYCYHQLDPRLKKSELTYCPKCGHELVKKG